MSAALEIVIVDESIPKIVMEEDGVEVAFSETPVVVQIAEIGLPGPKGDAGDTVAGSGGVSVGLVLALS